MKRVLGILSVLVILCTMLGSVVGAAAETYQLQFTAADMVYDTANNVWAKAAGDLSCVNYPGYAVVNTVANGGAAAIRKFVSPTAGQLKVMWGGGIYIDNGQGNLTGATVNFAITDGDGKILFPTNGDAATVTEGSPLEVSLTVDNVAVGDEFNFVVWNPSVDQLVCVLNVGVMVDGVAYSNGNGFLYDGTTQGGNGWHHQYAPAIVKSTVNDAENTVVALDFTEQEMTYESQYSAWGANGSILTGSWSNWGYVDQTNANIRKLVMPADGTFKIEHIWDVTGVTTDAGCSFDFAILNKDKRIIWPTTGGMFTVTATTSAVVDLSLAVEAGDAVYFVFNNGSSVPTPYYTSSVISLEGVQLHHNGGYGAADISAQGNGGWYYMYATDLTPVKAKDFRDLSALEAAIDAAEGYTDLSGYTEDSAAALTAALQAAKAITKANSQTEIDGAAAALTAAIDGLTAKPPVTPPPTPPFTLPEEDPNDPTVALKFTEQLMTYDNTLPGWTADNQKDCVLYPWAGATPSANKKVALRKFVAPASGDLVLAWGNGISIDKGQANFVITDKFGKIVYPANGGKVVLDTAAPHVLDITLPGVSAGDVFYFIAYNQTEDGAAVFMNFGVNINYVAYADNGNLSNPANEQGAGGWYYAYTTDLTEVKKSAYKNLLALNEQIGLAKAIPANKLALYSDESVKALRDALAAAEAITEANTQVQIDSATAALAAAIKGLTPKATPAGVNKVTFTEKPMTYSAEKGYWTAAGDPYCILTEPLNYPTPVTSTNLAIIRKLVMPRSGSLALKWGAGVYIDNTSGNYTGATAEFVIADKNGNLVFPQNGGVASVKEGTPVELDLTFDSLSKGDALYFIVFNPSTANVPVVFNSGVVLGGDTALQTSGGSLYGTAHEQGPVWYYSCADDLTFSVSSGGGQTPSDPPEIPFTLPAENPSDPTVALQFTEQLMTYDSTLGGWTADGDKNCVLYAGTGVTPNANQKVALRKFVAPVSGDMIIAWGNGVSIDKGQANFVITDKYGKIIYPAKGGKAVLNAAAPHKPEITFAGVSAGDVFYFIAYNQTESGATVSMHTAIYLNGVAYTENGNLYNSANEQGAGGWYYAYATDLTEVKKSVYRNLTALNEQIGLAKAIPADKLALYSDESVKALRDALKAALNMTEANTQEQIDAATVALAAAIKGLTPKTTPAGVNKVTFTEKPMTYSAEKGYWTADSDPSCILSEPLNYPTPVTTTNLAVIRKLVLPQSGSLVLKWGNGVYIDNTSGNYTGAAAEFVIADKDGNILYPQNGGAALIKEGAPVELDLTIENLKKGDALYFITFNPSMANVPVVYNVGVTLNGTTTLQTSGGSLYGSAHEQGPVWYYAFASDLSFLLPSSGGQGGGNAGGTDSIPNSPPTGEESRVWLAVIAVIFAASVLMRHKIFRKGEERA